MNEYSAPIAGHKADYWPFLVYCTCGWSFSNGLNWRQIRAYRRHIQAVEQELKEKK